MTTHAFILAAGMGRRLRPYTDKIPKPMVSVAGKPMIDHILDKLVRAGVTNATINLHYMGDIIREHLSTRNDIKITFSKETDLLETGGGLKKGLHTMPEDKPFYIINGDAFWTNDPETNIFSALSQTWDDKKMDLLLAFQPINKMILTKGAGDYIINKEGQAIRDIDHNGDMMFAGIRICHPRLFKNAPDGAFSFLHLMDEAEANKRLYAIEFQGDWHHISTPGDLDRVNDAISNTQPDKEIVNG